MKLKNGDIILHTNFKTLFTVINYQNDKTFSLRGYPHDQGSFDSDIRYIKKIITKETNPEYFL